MSAVPALACYHCGLAAASGCASVVIDGRAQPMCCPGCAAVAQAILDSGLGDYYRTRTEFGATADLVPPQLALYDSDPALAQGGDAVFSVEGLRCAACVWLIERRLARVPGVLAANMNVATERLSVAWNGAQCKPSDILGALKGIGYSAYPYHAARHDAARERTRKTLFRQLFVAGLAMMQVMMYAFPAYIADDGTLDADMAALMRWASLLLTVPAVLYSAQPFFRGAWLGVRQRLPGMDLPVTIGIAAAFVASVVATVRGEGEVYFDSVTMFIFLLLAGRYVELSARRRAAHALEQLQHALPASARRLLRWPASRETELVAAEALLPGDLVSVAPGEAVPADGAIIEGSTELALALLTGESRPQPRAQGDQVPGGAVNISQAIVLRVARAASDSTMAMLVQLAGSAGLAKPRLAQWADRVAAWFVAALLVLALAVFFTWQVIDPSRAWQVAIAVLVVSCPCALSLATPGALAAATGYLLRHGVLIVQPHVLETLYRATHVVFDKTGTLTEGKPVLKQVFPLGSVDPARCLQLAAALEAGSAHPLGVALRRAGGVQTLQASELSSVPGQGIEGRIDGVLYRLGRASFVEGLCGQGLAAGGVYLGCFSGAVARFDLADAVRADAAAVVDAIRARGQQVILLSGDDPATVQSVAAKLGIASALGAQLPSDKLAYVQQLQREGAIVAMVGDGINDAAVLGAADVSFAMGGGSALAQMSADCVLLNPNLAVFDLAASTARRTMRIMRQNLAWASVYNLVAIPAAALGLVNPWLSAVGMSLSSLLVVLNALRLR